MDAKEAPKSFELDARLFYDAIASSTDDCLHVIDMQRDIALIPDNMRDDFGLPDGLVPGLVPVRAIGADGIQGFFVLRPIPTHSFENGSSRRKRPLSPASSSASGHLGPRAQRRAQARKLPCHRLDQQGQRRIHFRSQPHGDHGRRGVLHLHSQAQALGFVA